MSGLLGIIGSIPFTKEIIIGFDWNGFNLSVIAGFLSGLGLTLMFVAVTVGGLNST